MKDKGKHIFWGGVAAALVGLISYFATGYDLFAGLWGCWAGVIAGCVKEWSDYQHDNKWDWRDLLATCIGAAVVALFIVLMHYAKG